jgi:hypothetical protein
MKLKVIRLSGFQVIKLPGFGRRAFNPGVRIQACGNLKTSALEQPGTLTP